MDEFAQKMAEFFKKHGFKDKSGGDIIDKGDYLVGYDPLGETTGDKPFEIFSGGTGIPPKRSGIASGKFFGTGGPIPESPHLSPGRFFKEGGPATDRTVYRGGTVPSKVADEWMEVERRMKKKRSDAEMDEMFKKSAAKAEDWFGPSLSGTGHPVTSDKDYDMNPLSVNERIVRRALEKFEKSIPEELHCKVVVQTYSLDIDERSKVVYFETVVKSIKIFSATLKGDLANHDEILWGMILDQMLTVAMNDVLRNNFDIEPAGL